MSVWSYFTLKLKKKSQIKLLINVIDNLGILLWKPTLRYDTVDCNIDPLHNWRLYLNNNTDTSLASHSWKNLLFWNTSIRLRMHEVLLFKSRRHLCEGSIVLRFRSLSNYINILIFFQPIDHFTVVSLVTWPLMMSKAHQLTRVTPEIFFRYLLRTV